MKKFTFFTTISALCFTLAVVSQRPVLATDGAPMLVIQAINPGYSVDGQANDGELIELRNISTDPLSLAGFSLYYTNTSGNRSSLIEFPEGSRISGETSLLLRLASSRGSSDADLPYFKTLAMSAGPLELSYLGQTVDSVCWNGAEGCLPKFSKETPTTIVRVSFNTYTHQTNYIPDWSLDRSGYIAPALADTEESSTSPQCRGLQFSEILTYYDESQSEQFIELFNGTDEPIALDGCTLLYKKKYYPLSGTVNAGDYFVRFATDFSLTKNPTSSNALSLIDANGDQLDLLEYPHGQKKSASYTLVGYAQSGQSIWRLTYRPTPGAANIYQEFRTCPAGKVINQSTGNCVKAATLEPVADCPAGKYRNPATGRCKKLETDSGPTPCKAGYERNPETNRCRKIKNNTGANYALVPETGGEHPSFAAVGSLVAIVLIGLVYLIYQFRHELAHFFRRIFRKLIHHGGG